MCALACVFIRIVKIYECHFILEYMNEDVDDDILILINTSITVLFLFKLN